MYLIRSVRSRVVSFALSVLGLALALAAVLSVQRMSDLVSAGALAGTRLHGQPVSVFTYSAALDYEMFLSQLTIRTVEQRLEGSGTLIGASGTRAVQGRVGDEVETLHVDLVSPRLFESLGIEVRGLSAGQRVLDNSTAVVSQRFLAERRLQQTPDYIEIKGRRLRVVGVAQGFTGLFDHYTDVWIDWWHAPGIIDDENARRHLDYTSYFWAVALPAEGREAEFRTRLQTAISEPEGLEIEQPFDSLRAIPGITNQTQWRNLADASLDAYQAIAIVALCAAVLNLAVWAALMRVSRAREEWTLLSLGLPRHKHLVLRLGYVLVGLIPAWALAAALEPLFVSLLASDSAVHLLLKDAAKSDAGFAWQAWLQSGGVALLVVMAVAHLVERAAGLRFGAPALRETSPVLRGVFRGLTVAMAVASCAALLLGYWALSTSTARQGELAGMDSDSTWTAQAKATDSKGDFGFADSAERALLAEQLRERLPQIERVGFGTLRPFAEGEGPLNSYTLPNAPDTTLRFRMNQIEGDALGAMGLKLVAGRALPESGYALEVLLDQRAAADLARRIGKPSALGELLRDASSMDYEIVGIVEAMPYNMELASPLGTVYQRMGSMVPGFHVLTRGGMNAAEVERALAEPFNVSALRFKLEEPQHLPALAERAQARYRARLLFATSTAAVTLFIALLALVSMVVVEARARSHALAVRACLGARPLNLATHAFRGLLLALGFGAVLGGLAALAATRSIPALAAIGTGSALDIALPVLALLLLGVLICALVLGLQQRGAALYRRLQVE